MERVSLKPILKWAGGKRQLLDVIREHLPTDITVYVEPFWVEVLFFLTYSLNVRLLMIIIQN